MGELRNNEWKLGETQLPLQEIYEEILRKEGKYEE